MFNRSSGILLPIFSLNNSEGIGTFGKSAYDFVDFLNKSGQTNWQILPLNQTSFGDSPYSSFSTYAGNPYFIDLKMLEEERLISPSDYLSVKWSKNNYIDYEILYKEKYRVLEIATNSFKEDKEYKKFVKENDWLNDYALFMSIKDMFNGCDFLNWPNEYKKKDKKTIASFKRKYSKRIRFYKVIQYWFYKQYLNLKEYANSKGIKIIGDLPIYVAMDSADVWSNINLFEIDKNYKPKRVAGVPADYFSEAGQLWGNPLYKWSAIKKDKYAWWIKRIKHANKLYDVIRIDHFRGFDSYYSIPFGMKDGKVGDWKKGPGISLFKQIKKELGDIEIIAEDLGIITDSVRKLLKDTGYPGMKVLEFAFDSGDDNPYLPHNCIENSVVYCGTHDNNTIKGWLREINEYTLNRAMYFCNTKNLKGFNYKMIETMMTTKSCISIIQIQDLLNLDETYRTNTPSTSKSNWCWRLKENALNDKLANRLFKLTKKTDRLSK